MRIKATIEIEYTVDPTFYVIPKGTLTKEWILAHEHHELISAISEIMDKDDTDPEFSIDVKEAVKGESVMTKRELLKALEDFTDDIEILVNLGQDCNNLTIVSPIIGIVYHHPVNDDITAKILLSIDPFSHV